jgi:hypothetical protein
MQPTDIGSLIDGVLNPITYGAVGFGVTMMLFVIGRAIVRKLMK